MEKKVEEEPVLLDEEEPETKKSVRHLGLYIGVGCAVVCDVSSVVAIEHNIANNAKYTQVIVVSLEEIVAGEVVHLFHIRWLEFEVDVGGEV